MPTLQRVTAGEQAGRLLLAAGLLTLLNDYLPGAGHLDIPVLTTTGGLAVLLGLVSLRLPWRRWPARAPLALVFVAFLLIAVSDRFGGVSTFSYAIYFVVCFVWVGIGQPPGTSFWVAPFAVAAYVAPFLGVDHRPSDALSSVTVAIPVCVLVGEVLARSVRRFEDSRRQLRGRVQVVERLAHLTAGLGADLDVDAVTRRLVDAAVEILDGRAAVFTTVRGSDAVVAAACGLPAAYVGLTVPLEGARLAQAADEGRLLVTPAEELAHLPVTRGGTAVTVACCAPQLLGGLTVVLDRPVRDISDEDRDVLRLLGAQGAAALLNATDHRRLREQREHEQQVVDVLADGVLVVASDGTVTSANTAAALLLGAAVDTLVGAAPPIDIAVPGVPVEHEISPGRWVEAASTVLPATGELVVALRDVSRQRALDAAKDLFLATTSHELRTPLTAVKGYVRTLQRHWEVLPDKARRDALATIAERTDALVELTNHLLLGARAGVSGHTATAAPFDLAAVVRGAAQHYARASERHAVVASVPESLPAALGDPVAVESILGQLIDNAIKYSPDGGDVRVSVCPAADDGMLAVEVRDRGIGIPAGSEEEIFAPFFQAGPTDTREYGGVGLGLYIVRQLVEAHGGRVSAQSQEGRGAVVRFTVPACPLPTPRTDSPAPDRQSV